LSFWNTSVTWVLTVVSLMKSSCAILLAVMLGFAALTVFSLVWLPLRVRRRSAYEPRGVGS